MYKIIGADQKVYGPITADQMRQWIAQGRVNAQTQVQVEGATDWRPLSSYPEFASLASTMAPLPGASPGVAGGFGGGRDNAVQMVKGPAIGLKVTAILGMIVVALGLVMNILTMAGVSTGMGQMGDNPEMPKVFNAMGGGLGVISNIVGIVVAVLILIGAGKMTRLENHQFAVTASVLALLPCVSPCCLLGIPFGIWALVVLNKPEVKSQFV